MFERVLICLDGSALAEQILPLAAENFAPIKSELILVSVLRSDITLAPPQSVHIPPFGGKIDPRAVPVSDMAGEFTKESEVGSQLAAVERENAETGAYLEKLAERLRPRGLKVTTLVLQGEPAETIIRWAEKHAISLIALTSHGQSGLEQSGYEHDAPMVLKGGFGRVAQQVLKDSRLPVLVIKPRPS
jgi:nucleotide-binding universal stress UspA family protein